MQEEQVRQTTERSQVRPSRAVSSLVIASLVLRNIAVIGAGLMGAGIAHVSIDKGYNVILRDTTSKALSRGYSQVAKAYGGYIKRKRITA